MNDSRIRSSFPFLSAAFAVLIFAVLAYPQSQALDAQIEGVVTDSNASAVAGAAITAVNIDTGAVRTTSTDVGGFFRFPLLTLGSYTVAAERSGFKRFERRGIQLNGSQTATVNILLEPGTPDENVTVTADTAIADESKFEIGRNVNSREVANLPLVSRNPFNFVLLQPGAAGRTVTNTLVVSLNAGGLLRRVGNHLDGSLVNDIDIPGFRLTFVSELFVKEVQLLSRGYSAEYGNTAGMVVNFITPSGTNRLAGNVTLLLRPSDLSSRSFGTSRSIPRKDISAYGSTATVGGPVINDRWHYYFGYERTVRQSRPDVNVLPADRAALVAAGLPDSIFVNTVKLTDLQPYLILRTDARLSRSNRLSFRYNRFDFDVRNAGFGGANTTERSFDRGGWDHAFAAQAVTTFSDTFFNEFRFLYAKRIAYVSANDQSGTGTSVLIGSNANIAAFGPNPQNGAVDTDQSTTQFQDTVTRVFSRHSVKAGGGFNLIHDETVNGLVSLYEFPSIDAYRNAVTGINRRAYTAYTETFGERRRPMDALFLNAFVQDDWRLSRRTKLNLGLRYEFYRPPEVIADSPLPFSRHFRIDKNNFALRLGASYLLNDGRYRTVIRAGTGAHYDPLQLRFYRSARLNNGDPQFFSFSFTPGHTGAPEFPNRLGTFPPGALVPPRDIDAVSPDFSTMYAVHSNVQAETAITNNMSLTAGYLHTAARHIPVSRNINCLPTAETLADGRPIYGAITVAPNGNATVSQACSNRILPQFGRIMMVESSGNLEYHALILQLTKRFSGGFQASANYTFSKARDDAPEDFAGAPQFQTDPSDRELDRGASTGDVRHLFRMSLVAEPRLRLSNKMARAVFNGFQFGVITLADSGEAFNITTNFDLNRDGVPGDRAAGIPRNFGRLPAFFGTDLRLSRRFKLRENLGFEVYGEAANVFNLKSVSSYDPPSISARNVITSPVNPLTAELRGPLPDFNNDIASWRPSRQMQIGLKLSF